MKFGQDFDIGFGIIPQDVADGIREGARVRMTNYGTITFVFYLGQATTGAGITMVLWQHDAASGGTSDPLIAVTEYWTKTNLPLDGTEQWVEFLVDPPEGEIEDDEWNDTAEVIAVVSVESEDLADGFEWISVATTSIGDSHLGCVVYLMGDLNIQAAPERLRSPNA